MLNAYAIYRFLTEDSAEIDPALTPTTFDADTALTQLLAGPLRLPGVPHDTYARLVAKLNGRERRKIDHNTYLERRGDSIAVHLHATDILTASPDNLLSINTNGWKTRTTMDRLDPWLGGGWRIFSLRKDWFWYNSTTGYGCARKAGDTIIPYTDRDSITASGTLQAQAVPVTVREVRKRRI